MTQSRNHRVDDESSIVETSCDNLRIPDPTAFSPSRAYYRLHAPLKEATGRYQNLLALRLPVQGAEFLGVASLPRAHHLAQLNAVVHGPQLPGSQTCREELQLPRRYLSGFWACSLSVAVAEFLISADPSSIDPLQFTEITTVMTAPQKHEGSACRGISRARGHDQGFRVADAWVLHHEFSEPLDVLCGSILGLV